MIMHVNAKQELSETMGVGSEFNRSETAVFSETGFWRDSKTPTLKWIEFVEFSVENLLHTRNDTRNSGEITKRTIPDNQRKLFQVQ